MINYNLFLYIYLFILTKEGESTYNNKTRPYLSMEAVIWTNNDDILPDIEPLSNFMVGCGSIKLL